MKLKKMVIAKVKYVWADSITAGIISSDVAPWRIGKNYFIRTVTMIDCGKLVAVTPTELVLKNASWIAETGRFADALKKCEFGEVEPFPDGNVIIGRGAVIDAIEISSVPRSQK
jgi:hypothetical protein